MCHSDSIMAGGTVVVALRAHKWNTSERLMGFLYLCILIFWLFSYSDLRDILTNCILTVMLLPCGFWWFPLIAQVCIVIQLHTQRNQTRNSLELLFSTTDRLYGLLPNLPVQIWATKSNARSVWIQSMTMLWIFIYANNTASLNILIVFACSITVLIVNIAPAGMKVYSSYKKAFLARDVIYTSRAYATMSVSVCLWWMFIGALYLIWVSNSDPTLPCIAAAMLLAGSMLLAMLLVRGSSHPMLASVL